MSYPLYSQQQHYLPTSVSESDVPEPRSSTPTNSAISEANSNENFQEREVEVMYHKFYSY